MNRKWWNLGRAVEQLHNPVEYDVEPYKRILADMDRFAWDALSDGALKKRSALLKRRARDGVPPDSLLAEAFALAREAAKRTLDMRPYDVQVMAGIALHKGKMVEMQTGEGKTLAAVLPACLNALAGSGVHVLTFNDYLARRDAEWMKPVYEFLGLEARYVTEGMESWERQKAYAAGITYVTAKEAGFDYLRDFLCFEKEKLVHRPFHYAIVDEADSILIDEARMPLVIAWDEPKEREKTQRLSALVRALVRGRDYELDPYGNAIYLTDTGILRVEETLDCGNLYAAENMALLAGIHCALQAEVLLQRDRDYIVSGGKIELIDEFTGRIADKRHWPDLLQAAVEAKEGVGHRPKGTIMGSVALQHFLSLYPKLAGMTGTARTAAAEFREYYNMDVAVIPTNRPCIRKDHPDLIFTHSSAKQKALVAEIRKAHSAGQPVLIGTGSVAESEALAGALRSAGIPCAVLNAKNDEMEAEIIKKAGESGAVTVSTNMAGRGVDIRLGGADEADRERVAAAGGLYVIGTGRHESRRMDDQLRGRAGRQGDPGESRFFISLEDELIKKHEIAKLIPAKHYPAKQSGPLTDPLIGRAIAQGQRFVEGYNSDVRVRLWKYGFIIEQQRHIIHKRRQDILTDVDGAFPDEAEKRCALYYINQCWAEYLDDIAYLREGIHLVAVAGKNPVHEFNRMAVPAFEALLQKIAPEALRAFAAGNAGPDFKGSAATRTYLVHDSPDQFGRTFLTGGASNLVRGPLFTFGALWNRLLGRQKLT